MRKKRDSEFAQKLQEAEASAEFGMVAEVRLSKDPRLILEILARRWPERWARPEIRAQLQVANIDTDELAKALLAGLKVLADRHAPKNVDDVDPELPDPPAAGDASVDPPGVSRS
jgi:hypothetical protein